MSLRILIVVENLPVPLDRRVWLEATTLTKQDFCRACFDGVYPVPIPEPEVMGKHLLEGLEKRVSSTTHIDALQHP